MGRVTVRRPVVTLSAQGESRRLDALAGEEPLELRVGGRPLAVTMRTPGHDVELAHGFLLSEAVIGCRSDVHTARFCGSPDSTTTSDQRTYNVLDVELAHGVPAPAASTQRNFYTTSSCGVCGKASLDAVRMRTRFPPAADPVTVTARTLAILPEVLRAAQRVFQVTGGLHAAGLFTASGELLVAREDIGRHNAVDKVLGWALVAQRIPATGCILMVSGRASFELVQKAVMAGIPILAAVSAPSSLAVELAVESGVTLIGFLRGDTLNVYAGQHRIERNAALIPMTSPTSAARVPAPSSCSPPASST